MTLKQIMEQAEWISSEAGVYNRYLQDVSFAASVKLGGLSLYGRGTPLATVPTAGRYASAKFTVPGFLYGGSPVVFPNVGCRPRSLIQRGPTLWGTLDAQVTRYVNRFTDGEVWISTTTNSRTGTQISWPLTGTTWPRGIRYLFVQLCGGGGAGGTGGLLATYNNQGGQGGACVVCVQLPVDGYVTIMAGGGGSGVGGFAANGNGGKASYVQSSPYYAQANGGGGGDGSISKNQGAGGTWQHNDGGVSPILETILGSYGAAGNTSGKTLTYTDLTPEGGSYTTEAAGAGGTKGGIGYGAGGNGGNGFVKLFY
jgi:hypothetical protein